MSGFASLSFWYEGQHSQGDELLKFEKPASVLEDGFSSDLGR